MKTNEETWKRPLISKVANAAVNYGLESEQYRTAEESALLSMELDEQLEFMFNVVEEV